MIGVISRREQLLRALGRFEWAGMAELQGSVGSGRATHCSLWAMQKLIAAGHAERDASRYRITNEGLLELARLKAKRAAELLAV